MVLSYFTLMNLSDVFYSFLNYKNANDLNPGFLSDEVYAWVILHCPTIEFVDIGIKFHSKSEILAYLLTWY